MLRSALVAFEFLKERGFVVSDEVKDSEDLQVWTSGSVSIRFIDDRGQLMVDLRGAGAGPDWFPLNAVRRLVTGERIRYPVLTEDGMPIASDIDFLRRHLDAVENLLTRGGNAAATSLRATLREMSREPIT